MTYNASAQPNLPPEDNALEIQSMNYWAGRTGRDAPPAPTYRQWGDKERFGRYMDPFGCQRHMDAAKRQWRRIYLSFFLVCGIGLLTAEVDWFVLLVIYPILGVLYFWMRSRMHQQYSQYKQVQDQIVATGEPQWVPYDKMRLRMIERNPRAILP
jgi:hypothetical protein